MNRAWLWRSAALTCAGLAFSLAVTAAFAQGDDAYDRTRRGGAVTTVGIPAAQVCSERLMQGDISDETVRACDRALESEMINRSQRMGLLINRGILHLRRSEGQLALNDFDSALEIGERDPEAHQNRGAALIALGRNGDAIVALTEALGLGVREPQKAYLNRGIAREALGDQRGALEDYSTALEIDPAWEPANQEMARIVRARQARLASRLSEESTP